jgi:uncharacterized cupin superfamily protein
MSEDTVINLRALALRQLRSSRTGEAFSESAVVSEPLGVTSMFVHYERLAPGLRASAAHSHSAREELVVVLSGRVTAWRDGVEVALGPMDSMAFLPGGATHYLRNTGDEVAELLVVASNPPNDEVRYASE